MLLVKVGEGVIDFAGGFFVFEDGVDGEAEGDYFDCHEAGDEPEHGECERLMDFKRVESVYTTSQEASTC